ncbi:MAG: response regulator transcription factor [Chloroflexi bacterium]|jgi:DNA-binding response OmpR family regulator|nr:response regulator transcription factor [Chloroflexota bacterium]
MIQSTIRLPAAKVFVVEDDQAVRSSIALSFEITWPETVVVEFESGSVVAERVATDAPDLVLLDLGLPDMDGLSVIRQIRKYSQVPIIVLSARTDDSSILAAIRLGADAFLNKPISQIALQAHVEATMRRVTEKTPDAAVIQLRDDLVIDLASGNATVSGINRDLTKVEMNLLGSLLSRNGRIVEFESLKNEAWDEPSVSDSALKMAIHRLRTKIDDDERDDPVINSHRGLGYSISR